jgi:hypothetical protein
MSILDYERQQKSPKVLKVALMSSCLLSMAACLAVPCELKVEGKAVRVDVSTLGEYPTSVSRIRLSEEGSHTILWELATGTRVPQIWGFTLREGINPVEPIDVFQGRQYRIVRPQGQSGFVLRKGVSYRIEIWDESGWRLTSRSYSFPT